MEEGGPAGSFVHDKVHFARIFCVSALNHRLRMLIWSSNPLEIKQSLQKLFSSFSQMATGVQTATPLCRNKRLGDFRVWVLCVIVRLHHALTSRRSTYSQEFLLDIHINVFMDLNSADVEKSDQHISEH